MPRASRAFGLDRLTRRGFLKRVSGAALVSYVALVGARPAANQVLAAPGSIDACDQVCNLQDCEGCTCGGDLFRCVGCGVDAMLCFTGHNCVGFCRIAVC
jgi:hypothetical protein